MLACLHASLLGPEAGLRALRPQHCLLCSCSFFAENQLQGCPRAWRPLAPILATPRAGAGLALEALEAWEGALTERPPVGTIPRRQERHRHREGR